MTTTDTERLFSYGTLQLARLQRKLFARTLAGAPDTLAGYVVTSVTLRDAAAVATSGIAVHKALIAGDGPPIEGVTLRLTPAELVIADDYEGNDYRRVAVTLASGTVAWVYLRA